MTQIQTFSTSRPGSMPYYVPILKKLDWKVALCFTVAAIGVYYCIQLIKRPSIIQRTDVILADGKKLVLRHRDHPELRQARTELEKGISISRATIRKIEQLMPKILTYQDDSELQWVRQDSGIIFRLSTLPGLIFKIQSLNVGQTIFDGRAVSGNALTEVHFASLIEGQKVCLEKNLDLLFIPHTKMFEIKHNNDRYQVLAQEFIPHKAGESAQEDLWEKKSSEMTKAVHQFAIFIACMDCSAVARRDMPLIESDGKCGIALLDLKYREGAHIGLFGDVSLLGRLGLIRCLFSEEQMDSVFSIASQHQINLKEETIQRIKEEAKGDIELFYKIRQFHENKGIKEENARAPIVIQDVNALGFDEEENEIEILNSAGEREKKWVTLEDALNEMVSAINDALQKTSDQASIRGKRFVKINLDHYPVLARYRNCGAPSHNNTLTPNEEKRVWLHRVLQALVDNKYIFSFIARPDGCFYYIQA